MFNPMSYSLSLAPKIKWQMHLNKIGNYPEFGACIKIKANTKPPRKVILSINWQLFRCSIMYKLFRNQKITSQIHFITKLIHICHSFIPKKLRHMIILDTKDGYFQNNIYMRICDPLVIYYTSGVAL